MSAEDEIDEAREHAAQVALDNVLRARAIGGRDPWGPRAHGGDRITEFPRVFYGATWDLAYAKRDEYERKREAGRHR